MVAFWSEEKVYPCDRLSISGYGDMQSSLVYIVGDLTVPQWVRYLLAPAGVIVSLAGLVRSSNGYEIYTPPVEVSGIPLCWDVGLQFRLRFGHRLNEEVIFSYRSLLISHRS